MIDGDTDILSVVRSQFHAAPPSRLGVAVSGGGDSVALLHILSRCLDTSAVDIRAVTVDHRLRPEAADEAAQVAALAGRLGLSHTTLRWQGWDGQGNLQAAAREARYALICDWARQNGIALVALGHTADDQAETVLMRLGRSAGVDGLAGIPARRTMHGVSLLRPMLGLTRQELRDYLGRNGVTWCEDPSNDDSRYDRVQARSILAALAPLGVTTEGLAAIAGYMGEAREALDWYSFLTARDIALVNSGDVILDLRRFRTLPQDIARRLLQRAVMWVGQADYPPRRAAMAQAIDGLRHGRGATLGGCRILVVDGSIWICREYAVVRDMVVTPGQPWDGRWTLIGPVMQDGLTIAPLGRNGLAQVPDWRSSGRPHGALMASPAVWCGDTLVAAPLAGMANGWRAELQESAEAFFAALLSN